MFQKADPSKDNMTQFLLLTDFLIGWANGRREVRGQQGEKGWGIGSNLPPCLCLFTDTTPPPQLVDWTLAGSSTTISLHCWSPEVLTTSCFASSEAKSPFSGLDLPPPLQTVPSLMFLHLKWLNEILFPAWTLLISPLHSIFLLQPVKSMTTPKPV